MIVTCSNCQTRFNLPDSKIPETGAKVKCSKCAHVFKVEPPAATPEEEVENLLDEETQAPDTQAGEAFDETYEDMAAKEAAESSAEESVAEEPADEPASSVEDPAESPDESMGDDLFDDVADESTDEAPEEDAMSGMDDLFDDTDETPAAEEESGDVSEDVDALFGDDDEDDLFADDSEDDASDDEDDLFADDDGDSDDLFADDDDDEDDLDDDEGSSDDDPFEGDTDFGLDQSAAEPKKKGKMVGCLIILLVLALGIGAAVYFKAWTMVGLDAEMLKNVPYVGKMFMEETGGEEEAAPGESPADRVRKIELRSVKQYYVANEKTGNLFVVEGKAINKFESPKERIKVEVILYGANGEVLMSKAFLCGNQLSQFQLQVQSQKEVEDGLSSEVGILSNNTFVQPGGAVPFMAVFFEPPADVREFLVKVVDVADSK